ncbi:MAG: zinc-ribbon domain-containing protein [Ruminococcus sp.]|nr:zinc-ribbon domain-containing protein [Ruminococcus sp.]
MFCKFCGAQLPDNAKFCGSCGNQLVQPGQASAQTPHMQAGAQQTNQPHMQANTPGAGQPYQASNNSMPNQRPYQGAPMTAPAPKIKVKTKYNLGNLIIWLGCILGIVSLFTTYATASLLGISESVSLMDTDDGIIFLVIIAIVAVISLFKLNIVCIIGSLFTIFFVNMEYQNVSDSYYSGMVEFGMGNTLLWVGAILMLLGSVAAFVLAVMQRNKDRQAAMNSQMY